MVIPISVVAGQPEGVISAQDSTTEGVNSVDTGPNASKSVTAGFPEGDISASDWSLKK